MPCVYEIVRKNDETVVYVGSSRDLCTRTDWHKKSSEMPTMRKLYDLILENGGFDNHEFKVLEETEKVGTDLLLLERKYYDEKKPIGNSKRPILYPEEREEAEARKRAYFFHKWKKAQ